MTFTETRYLTINKGVQNSQILYFININYSFRNVISSDLLTYFRDVVPTLSGLTNSLDEGIHSLRKNELVGMDKKLIPSSRVFSRLFLERCLSVLRSDQFSRGAQLESLMDG